jgi:hypothetical protein
MNRCGFIMFILVIMASGLLSGCTPKPADPTALPTTITPVRTYQLQPTGKFTLPSPSAIFLPATQSDTPALTISPPTSNNLERYGLLELDLQTSVQANNPYDPQEINIEVQFISPSGKKVEVGAFWFQDYDLQSRQPKGQPGWKVRFTPTEAGQWWAAADLVGTGLQSEAIRFQVNEADDPGFIRLNPDNSRYLAYDNGDFFFPIGLNMGWWGGSAEPVEQYSHWLNLFAANGGNTMRVWMAAWSFGIEWKDTGLGNYDDRLYQAWLLDQLFSLAHAHHVKVILVLMNHGPLSLHTNTEWKDNPYNASLGGPLSEPEQFVTDTIARAYYQRRLNYIVDRWGYSPDLLAWEWFNEVNLTPITDDALMPWLEEMTAYLDELDVNRHLTTLSFAMRSQSSLWNLPGLDIIQVHEYSSQANASEHDLAGRAAQDFQLLASTTPEKPILMGEFGYSAENYGDDIETTGIHLHNGIWATTFGGYAGSGMYWWWDVYVEKYNLWKHFNGLATFMEGVNLARYKPFSPLEIIAPGAKTGQVNGLGLQGEDTLVWLRSDDYTVQASVAARGQNANSKSYLAPLLENLTLTLKDMQDGSYIVEWFDPQSAKWLEVQTGASQNHELAIPIPPFRDDLAARISRNP